MKTNLALATLLTAGMAMAQIVIPEGTKVRVRLEQNLSSETAELGGMVDFTVMHELRVGDAVVMANGAKATGTIVTAQAKRRMGRGGQLDFTIERVQMVDGNWLSVRYTPMKSTGKGNGVSTGVLTAGLAMAFWPAAPLGLLRKGHDATIAKGRIYEVFADASTYVAAVDSAPDTAPQAGTTLVADNSQGHATTLNINANQPGADIEVDGMFVGNAPSTIQLAAGVHRILVRQGASAWQRDLQAYGGTVNISAVLAPIQLALRSN
jgi:PEGA domain